MRSEGYSTWSVCLSVRASSRTTGYEAANEWYQRFVNNEETDINVAIFLKNDCVPEIWREKGQRAVDRARALSGMLTRHVAGECATPHWLYDPQASLWINMLSKVYSQCSIIVQVASSLWMQPCLPIYKTSGESIGAQKSG